MSCCWFLVWISDSIVRYICVHWGANLWWLFNDNSDLWSNHLVFENLEINSTVHRNASSDGHARTTITASFPDVSVIKLCPYFVPYRLALRIAFNTEITLKCRQDLHWWYVQSLCSLHQCKWHHRWAAVNKMQHSERLANGLHLWRGLATLNYDTRCRMQLVSNVAFWLVSMSFRQQYDTSVIHRHCYT